MECRHGGRIILGSQASRLSHSQAGLQLKRGDPSAFMVLSEGSFGNDGKLFAAEGNALDGVLALPR